jgi:hypothetical protein
LLLLFGEEKENPFLAKKKEKIPLGREKNENAPL